MKPFTYQLISEYSIQQFEWFSAITINKDCTILLAGRDNKLKYLNTSKEWLNKLKFEMNTSHMFILQTS
ncbi:unnamed protein product [Paramecium octaurelia]|uniref:Uncharacterized protein n=1 Tax=Paramecium octaurelia TaxID=43137 RepID=A0A8S1WTT2_PAROT|nr:unnamed protein product [Paramecium octaurelia]